MVSIGILNDDGGWCSALEAIEEQESLIGVLSSNEFVIGVSFLHVMVMIVVVISMVIVMVTVGSSAKVSRGLSGKW